MASKKNKTLSGMKISYGQGKSGDALFGVNTGAVKSAEAKVAHYMDQLYALQMQKAPTGYSLEDMKARQAFYARQEKANLAIQEKIRKAQEVINREQKKVNTKTGGK